jgi:hypothetical protein
MNRSLVNRSRLVDSEFPDVKLTRDDSSNLILET